MQPTESHPEQPQAPRPETQPASLERAQAAPAETTPVEPPQTSHNVPTANSLPQPVTVPPPVDSATAPATSPTNAGDGDEIEATWVEQADTIKEKYQDDPFAEEEAAESLSQDYLQKRFGIDVDKS